MRRKVILTTFALFLCFSVFYAQPQPPVCPPYPAAAGCGLADPDCENGLDGYISKPMRPHELQAELLRVMQAKNE